MLNRPTFGGHISLAADFTFPILDEEKVIPLASSVKSEEVNLDALDLNKYNSLK